MKNHKYAALFAAALVALAVTSCNKESVRPTDQQPSEPTIKRPPSGSGIRSIDSWTGSGSCWIDDFSVTTWGQKPDDFGFWGPLSGTSAVYTYGAAGNTEAYVYMDGTIPYLTLGTIGSSGQSNIALSFPGPIAAIEEIEIHPSTGEVYALVRMNKAGQTALYHLDISGGSATWLATLHAAGAGTVGSITFVPNGASGHKLLYVYEPVANASAVMNYYTIATPTAAPSLVSTASISGNFVPGTGSINMCYGNAQLFFARDAGDLYAISGTSLPTSGTSAPFGSVAETDANFANRYDFGYYGI